MTDLDKIKACARAMEIERVIEQDDHLRVIDSHGQEGGIYNPLRYLTQADALEGWLLERGEISMFFDNFRFVANDHWVFDYNADMTVAENRRRARVECVAKMMEGV